MGKPRLCNDCGEEIEHGDLCAECKRLRKTSMPRLRPRSGIIGCDAFRVKEDSDG